ncbi:Concanavalin A-like lectin/glucanase [Metarhizium album ARSEF 1941]|uniref:Concanavalin A-like lectin/glucanase n=1 Tax=Metarhizium album (strain ARSEF 1941) TaxID=1081103 RepID=A0A0B2WP32_METAS|nr:Concanavalin A-like lectin/glucanase [Metarhizium album ARSEF 1941]KHN95758.1 Concanavalin A-like lectin/glucanase [Metarhizium album ARSEF 1941]
MDNIPHTPAGESPPSQRKPPKADSGATSSALDAPGSPSSVITRDYSSLDIASRRRFKSYRLRGEFEKPWLSDPAMNKTRWNNWIVRGFILLGLVLSGVTCVLLVWPYRDGDYCLIYEDHFSTFNKDVWSHEVQLDGFGTGSFDWTTTDPKNSYVDSDGLHIVPTLTNETTPITNADLFANYTLDLTKDGSCTSNNANASCIITSDPQKGTMIPPIRSARLSTKGKKSIRYGRVEVVARLPKGDWIWPAICMSFRLSVSPRNPHLTKGNLPSRRQGMMPEGSTYGDWPRSGEIDIMESRGNARSYPEGGRNYYYSTLHWGPTAKDDSYWRTTDAKMLRRGDFSKSFHRFGIQWTPKYMYFYIDNRAHQIMFVGFDKDRPLYELGRFASMAENQTLLANPWAMSNSSTGNAPFDQRFYLILNVAVGSKTPPPPPLSWRASPPLTAPRSCRDHVGDKPWIDGAKNAQWTFWDAAARWLPTWGDGADRGMTVRSVEMWQAGRCGSPSEL